MCSILIYLSVFYPQIFASTESEGMDSRPKLIMLVALTLKSVLMVPFITYEYYLILFEQLFVDTNNLQIGGLNSSQIISESIQASQVIKQSLANHNSRSL